MEPFLFHSIIDECKSEFASRASQRAIPEPQEKEKEAVVVPQPEIVRREKKKKKQKRKCFIQPQGKDSRTAFPPMVSKANGSGSHPVSKMKPVSEEGQGYNDPLQTSPDMKLAESVEDGPAKSSSRSEKERDLSVESVSVPSLCSGRGKSSVQRPILAKGERPSEISDDFELEASVKGKEKLPQLEPPPVSMHSEKKEESVSKPIASAERTKASCSKATSPSPSFPVQLNDGPDLSARYSDHAGRWANLSRDMFSEDPVYKKKPYSKTLQEEIRFRHSFGRALIPVIRKLGKKFTKIDRLSGECRENYTLPGEIIRSGAYEKVVFTVSVNPATGDIIHLYATQKTPLTLIMEYAKDGYFPADEEEMVYSQASRCRHSRSYILPDDGSRVTEVLEDRITVTQADGTELIVYPFPSFV